MLLHVPVARRIPEDRFERLLECATRVFIEAGYRRTQMADVAVAMGVAKGTVYGYVESKEALFDLVARCADRDDWRRAPPAFPVRTPKPGATLRYLRGQLVKRQSLATLADALGKKRVANAAAELAGIVRELYDLLARNREIITLIVSSARDYPELAALWVDGGRGRLLALLARYLESRIAAGHLRAVPAVDVAARLILEAATFWAVHRHRDLRPQAITDAVARDTVVQFAVSALRKEAPR